MHKYIVFTILITFSTLQSQQQQGITVAHAAAHHDKTVEAQLITLEHEYKQNLARISDKFSKNCEELRAQWEAFEIEIFKKKAELLKRQQFITLELQFIEGTPIQSNNIFSHFIEILVQRQNVSNELNELHISYIKKCRWFANLGNLTKAEARLEQAQLAVEYEERKALLSLHNP